VGISPGDGAVTVVGTGIQGERLGAYDRDGKALWSATVPGGVETVDVSRGGDFVVAASNTTRGQRVYLFDRHGKLTWTFQLDQPAREPVRVRISEGGDRVYAAMERDGSPVITGWDFHGEVTSRITLPSDVIDFDLSRDGGRLVAVAREGKLLYYAFRGR
jgi:2',3'-cyclic-nucleotide 2'-phosphodiesterase (5'-nucleotidase family)